MAIDRATATSWLRWACRLGVITLIVAGCSISLAWLHGLKAWSRDATCYKQSLSLSNALAYYVQDYDGYLPPSASPHAVPWTAALRPYLGSETLLVCPAAGDAVRPSYLLRRLPAGAQVASLPEQSNQILGIDGGPSGPAWRHRGMSHRLGTPVDQATVWLFDGSVRQITRGRIDLAYHGLDQLRPWQPMR